jgi:hypothetical protein
MKKVLIAVTAIVMLAAVAAYAATPQENTYSVTASLSPTKSGTKKKPTAVQLVFNYIVGEKNGERPAVVNQYKIGFDGIKVTQTGLPTCTATQLNNAQTDSGCPKGSVVGQGTVNNMVGPTSDPTNSPGNCTLGLKIYNGATNHAALWLTGTCVGTAVHNAIDATYVKSGTLSVLQFTVPGPLLHPIPGLDNSVTNVKSTINKISVGKGAKKTGYYATVGGCKAHKRKVQVVFVTEANSTSPSTTNTAKTTAKCS